MPTDWTADSISGTHQFFTSTIHRSNNHKVYWTDTKRVYAGAQCKMLILKYLFQQITKFLDLRGVWVCVFLLKCYFFSQVIYLNSFVLWEESDKYKRFSFCRYTAPAPAFHVRRKPYCNHRALFVVCFKMGTKIHGKTKTIQYPIHIAVLQCPPNRG